MKSIYAIYGSGGYAREVMPILRDHIITIETDKSELYFIDDFSKNI